MTFEVDVRGVGEESKSGDAIALRYGDFSDRRRHRVVVIDGGFTENGNELVRHIKQEYGTDVVDFVISTHPDNDHVCGLRPILEELRVGHLLMHQPWLKADAASQILRSARVTPPAGLTYIQRSLTAASELAELAARKGIPITEPYAGVTIDDGVLRVLGPSETYYNELLPDFGQVSRTGIAAAIQSAIHATLRRLQETWDQDALLEPEADAVSAVNNSSVIIHAEFGERSFLFCADAGVSALAQAALYGRSQGIEVSETKYIQLPHHGSKRNVGPKLLDYLIGQKVPQGTPYRKHAFISAAKQGAPKHPSKRVINAAIRRGARVFVTEGRSQHYYSSDLGARPGWTTLVPQKFHDAHDEEE